MAKSVDVTKLNIKDIDKRFEKLPQSVARKIDNGGTRPVRRKSTKKKKTK